MEPTLGIVIGILGLVAAFFGRSPRFQLWIFGGITIGVICNLITGFEPDKSLNLIHLSLISVVGLALISSLIHSKYTAYFGLVAALLAFLPMGAKASYFGFEIVWTFKVSILVLSGAFITVLADFISKFGKVFLGADESRLRVGITLFTTAILVFFATFQASYFGVLLVAIGVFSSAIAARSIDKSAPALGLILLSWAFYTSKSTDLMNDALLRGNLFMGLIGGLGMIFWSKAFQQANRFQFFLAVIFPVSISLIFVALGKVNPNFGGIPAFIGILIGSAFAFMTHVHSKTDSKKASYVALPFILIGFTGGLNSWLTPPKLETKTLLEPTTSSESNQAEKKSDVLEIPAVQLDNSWEGTWKSVSESSKLEFELGPEGGKTQGAIKEARVTMKLDKDGNPKELVVKMKTSNVTTFNDLRDESVLGEGYLNAEKYPKISYSSSKIEKKNDRFLIEGTLDFLGQSHSVSLEAKLAAKGEKNGKKYVVLVGKSLVDRTKHGMESDAKIGDLVEVNFEVAFQ